MFIKLIRICKQYTGLVCGYISFFGYASCFKQLYTCISFCRFLLFILLAYDVLDISSIRWFSWSVCHYVWFITKSLTWYDCIIYNCPLLLIIEIYFTEWKPKAVLSWVTKFGERLVFTRLNKIDNWQKMTICFY